MNSTERGFLYEAMWSRQCPMSSSGEAVAPGATVSPEELIGHCRDHIASYKKPRWVEFVEAIPRTGFVVDYDALDERFGGGNYPGGTTRSA